MREEFVSYKNEKVRLSVFEAGRGRPSVVFIPGSGCYAMLYGEFLEALSKEGFNVVGIDLIGHGASTGRRGDFRYEDAMGCVRAAAEYAAECYEAPVGVTGSSLGGILALYANTEIDLLKSAVCHNVMDAKNPPGEGKRAKAFNNLRRLFPPIAAVFPRSYVPLQAVFDWRLVFDDRLRLEELRKDDLMVWNYTISTLNSLFVNTKNKPDVENIESPTMILVSSGDQILTEKYCRSVYDRLTCKKNFLSIKDAGHMLYVEHKEKVIGPVTEWFNETLV